MDRTAFPSYHYCALPSLCRVPTTTRDVTEEFVTRVMIVDDDARFRRHIRQFLESEPSMELVGEADNGEDAIRKAVDLKVDLVLMDVRMPGMSGIEATRRLRAEVPDATVIVLTMYDLEEYREAAMACGASGYVTKRSMVEELMPTIRTALER